MKRAAEECFDILSKVESGLKALRDGKRMETNLMTDKEKRLIWTLVYVFAKKRPVIAMSLYYMVLSFITFHGIFIAPAFGSDGSDHARRHKWCRMANYTRSVWSSFLDDH